YLSPPRTVESMTKPHFTRITLLCALALLSWACTADDVGSPSRLILAADLAIADSAVVVFGLDQDSLGYDLSSYSDARVLSDNRLAVFCCDQSLLIFSADGNLESSFGGRGEGPGQFRMAHMTRLSGDTLLVYDAPSRRVSSIHPSRGLNRTIGLGIELLPQYV